MYRQVFLISLLVFTAFARPQAEQVNPGEVPGEVPATRPSSAPIITTQPEPSNKNVFYISSCRGSSKVSFYIDIDESQEGELPLFWEQLRGSKGNAKGLPVLEYQGATITNIPDPQNPNFDFTFEVDINSKPSLDKALVGIIMGKGHDKFGGIDCMKDNGRELYHEVLGERCLAEFYCTRVPEN